MWKYITYPKTSTLVINSIFVICDIIYQHEDSRKYNNDDIQIVLKYVHVILLGFFLLWLYHQLVLICVLNIFTFFLPVCVTDIGETVQEDTGNITCTFYRYRLTWTWFAWWYLTMYWDSYLETHQYFHCIIHRSKADADRWIFNQLKYTICTSRQFWCIPFLVLWTRYVIFKSIWMRLHEYNMYLLELMFSWQNIPYWLRSAVITFVKLLASMICCRQ